MGSEAMLLDWNGLRSNNLYRYPYTVADVAVHPFKYENSDKCPVKSDVLTAAYKKSILLAVPKCQKFYYFGTETQGSIVCCSCMVGARYTLFSVKKTAYINLIHVHSTSLAYCCYCNNRMSYISIKRCQCNRDDHELVKYAPMYRKLCK